MDLTTADKPHDQLGHVVPKRVLLGVWGALVILTLLTVAVTYKDFGRFNIWLAIGIAAVKASLVGLYFMHLRYDSPFNAFVLIVALSFVAIFIIGTITDTRAYQQTMETPLNWTISP